jgi:heat shock protein HtpX
MGLWSEPMTAKMAAFLLAALVTLFVLIGLEIRSHAPPKPARPPPRPPKPQAASPGATTQTAILVGLIVAPFAVIGLSTGVASAAVALAIAIAIVLWSLRHAGPAILAQCGARHVSDSRLNEAVQELAAKAGIPPPRILEIHETHPNAFALGANAADAAIVVTLGLRSRLTDDELRAVMAHEISHIARRDTARAIVGVTLMSAIATLALRLRLIGFAVRRQGGGALLFLAILSPLSALVRRLAGSRGRAYRADREGARLCGNPDDLIRALVKLDASTQRVRSITANDQPALAALFFVNPLPNSWVGRLFAAHPPISRRIARLRAIGDIAAPHRDMVLARAPD